MSANNQHIDRYWCYKKSGYEVKRIQWQCVMENCQCIYNDGFVGVRERHGFLALIVQLANLRKLTFDPVRKHLQCLKCASCMELVYVGWFAVIGQTAKTNEQLHLNNQTVPHEVVWTIAYALIVPVTTCGVLGEKYGCNSSWLVDSLVNLRWVWGKNRFG